MINKICISINVIFIHKKSKIKIQDVLSIKLFFAMFFTSCSYFIKSLLRFKLLFTISKTFKFVFEIWSKLGHMIGYSWKGKTILFKMYLLLNFFKRTSSNFYRLIFMQNIKKILTLDLNFE